MGFAILLRLSGSLDQKAREEIIYAESPVDLGRRFDKDRETVCEERWFPTISGGGLSLVMQLKGSSYRMSYVQGGGIGKLYPGEGYINGNARTLFNDIVIDALSATSHRPVFNQSEWLYRSMVKIVGEDKVRVSPIISGYRLAFVLLYRDEATDEQRAKFLRETRFGQLFPGMVDRVARRWDRDPFQGLPASNSSRSKDIAEFLRPAES